MLLLTEGHLLVVKQRKPVLLIEFGPRRDDPLGWGKQAQLRRKDAFELSDGGRTKLFPLRSWKLHRDHEEVVESANYLVLDDEGRLHAISSRSRCVYDLVPGSDDDELKAPTGGGFQMTSRFCRPSAGGLADSRRKQLRQV